MMFAKKTGKSDFELAFLGRTRYTNVFEAHGVGISPPQLTDSSVQRQVRLSLYKI